MKILAVRSEMPRCELSADVTEVSVTELLLMPKFGTNVADKDFAVFLGG
jgi:hypothetical protein